MPFTAVPESGGLLLGCLNVFHVIPGFEGNLPPAPRPRWMDRVEYQLVSSRNGSSFQRAGFRQFFLPNGPAGAPDSGVLWMYQPPVYVNDSIYFFYSGFEGTHWAPDRHEFQGGVVMAARLRRDGWVSLDAGKPAEVVTKFFVMNGSALVLNLDCRSTNVGHNILETYGNGSVAVEVVGADFQPVPGFERANCVPISGVDSVRHEVRWNAAQVASLHGKVIRLHFVLEMVKLFSFHFV